MIEQKKILILGMARSGIAVAKLMSKYQNEIIISDIIEQEKQTIEELKNLGIQIKITKEQEILVDTSFDYIIKNPAIKSDHPALVKARSLHIPIINELEASFPLLPKDITIIGITGSNGKTTTTTIVYELLKKKHRVHVGGNIGTPLSTLVPDIQKGDILVLEISDHQLCDMYQFKTDISVITNLSEVHLDFHGSYEKYKEMKKKILNNHTKESIAILNKDNKDVLKLTEDIVSQKMYFSKTEETDIYLKDNQIFYHNEKVIDCDSIKIKGIHNYENCMVGILIAKMFHISNEEIKEFLSTFKGVEHRIEFVRELKGRIFYNDSKATNNEATIIALNAFQAPTILLMGGLDRNIPFDDISSSLTQVKSILCYGQTKDKIKEFAIKNNKEVFVVDTLIEATKKAYELSKEGDVILLSPACASWDQYPNFEKRGLEFKETVNKLT